MPKTTGTPPPDVPPDSVNGLKAPFPPPSAPLLPSDLVLGQTVESSTDSTGASFMRPLLMGDRMTVKLTAYHEQYGEVPETIDKSFATILSTSHQAYKRRLRVGATWMSLDTAWIPIEDVGYIFLENKAGTDRTTTPSKEEQEEIDLQYVSVAIGDGSECFVVRPGRVFFADASMCSAVRLRANSKLPVRVNVVVFPR